ncbi:hypothetical protein GLAREA_10648 [Glarea lozoyensis ATCC 20868]|uniref:Uncharacterized protein n=1 Tax=Glarea lozoyensis (strain ATCC 20868 / MF5171) TaxID=1116229 RepID=S3E9H3_GLAL2|nr:uncharacterized protein GLAREA_10648 [Glarea lozoyensis ATCC 20868]EPE34953.1 hypothetical protein GLAREA_10648 [Glarea lozoyensis ATCC 20868]
MAQPQVPQFFGLIPTGHAPILTPTNAPTPTSLVYTIPVVQSRPFSHIVVFLVPGVELPPDTAASVYISLPSPGPSEPTFKFLGGIGPGKESAIFKISGLSNGNSSHEVDMDAPESSPAGDITIGISIEPASQVSAQMASLSASNSQALVVAAKPQQKPDTLVLAQRIIKNAFNFLASFSGNVAGGIEVVPLKAFEEWWRKFEGKVRNDPGFLERDGD